MSFSSDIKKELTQIIPGEACCMEAEIAGLLRILGSIVLSEGKIGVKISTENPAVARLFVTLVKQSYGSKTELSIGEAAPLSRGRVYELGITPEMGAEHILRETGMLEERDGHTVLTEGLPPALQKTRCCRRAMLRGLFMAAGSVTDPEKGYHMEIVCTSETLARDVRKLVNGFGLRSKIVQRKNRHVVYIKEAEQITDFLSAVGAHGQLFRFEDVRITKDLRNTTNRISNCDSANFERTVNAAQRQLASIRFIRDTAGLESLPPKLQETARLRLEYPEVSLAELAEMFDPPLKKSGINHRLLRLEELASTLGEQET
ncbi:MAG TPA: DNA-binding protein WhiA [Clostridiales bacterium]|jgi:DNA-binding protein WhiA|nr:DNA-binding protein WhiA [Clostridiales bacterium]